ncbi:conserved hypothetical protein [Talaromyces stipitatus ATCC 10500]|uniref:LysR family regulatory protein n=1 Tax=Talaromyces stipitatus (strain ATCC 10500 / CBS 375.48 / QM 6759 / NRRL 1006) TaxID=441959 RepID=B8MF88_TALSN|nr:uncharacterized protein TSTA_012940 [Talaromyces stipitatus ATCC 10500]EED16187.1 conserved hypothetical protein [Talaromyces stipitatus ATCC 10500]
MEVIPIPATDQQKPINNIRTRTFFIIDTRLEESTLQSSLDDLIRNHWRKLGGRLAKNSKNGLLEYRVPKAFADDKEYKLFEWSCTQFESGIDKSAPLAFFHDPPAAEKGATLLHSVQEVDELVRPATWPDEIKDDPVAPLLFVHLSLFTDASVVALSVPHTVADQMGVGNIMRAWFGLAYHNKTPPEMTGYTGDILATSAKKYTDWPKHEIYRKGLSRVRNKFEYFFVVLGFVPELVLNKKEDSHIVFFPRPMLERLRERYTTELKEEYGDDPGLSLGDVINAILTKVSHTPRVNWALLMGRQFHRIGNKKSRTITLSQLVNLRNKHTSLPPSKSSTYIHNGIHYVSSRFLITPSTSAREIAYKNRQAITTQSSSQSYEIGLAVMREQVRRGQGTHICEPFEWSYFVTNWCLAWKGLDLFPTTATDTGDSEKEGEGAEKRIMVLGRSKEKDMPGRFTGIVMCQTEEGYWCEFAAPEKRIRLIEEHLRRDPMLEDF